MSKHVQHCRFLQKTLWSKWLVQWLGAMGNEVLQTELGKTSSRKCIEKVTLRLHLFGRKHTVSWTTKKCTLYVLSRQYIVAPLCSGPSYSRKTLQKELHQFLELELYKTWAFSGSPPVNFYPCLVWLPSLLAWCRSMSSACCLCFSSRCLPCLSTASLISCSNLKPIQLISSSRFDP